MHPVYSVLALYTLSIHGSWLWKHIKNKIDRYTGLSWYGNMYIEIGIILLWVHSVPNTAATEMLRSCWLILTTLNLLNLSKGGRTQNWTHMQYTFYSTGTNMWLDQRWVSHLLHIFFESFLRVRSSPEINSTVPTGLAIQKPSEAYSTIQARTHKFMETLYIYIYISHLIHVQTFFINKDWDRWKLNLYPV